MIEKDGMRPANPTPPLLEAASSSPFTNPTATHTRSRRKPPSSVLTHRHVVAETAQGANPICGIVGSTRSLGFVCHQYHTMWERDRFWQNERESWTDFLKFFFHFIIINNFFLYNNMWPKMVRWTYDLGAWRGSNCLITK